MESEINKASSISNGSMSGLLSSSDELHSDISKPESPLSSRDANDIKNEFEIHKSKVEESLTCQLKRLGTQRPEVFSSRWTEIGFIFSISMSQVLAVCDHLRAVLFASNARQEMFVSGFTVVLPKISQELHIPPESSVWPASAFSLTVGSFLLIFGRFSDIYGGYPVYVAGSLWLAIWSLLAGFSSNSIMLNFCRAFQGLGPAAFLPSSIMIFGSIYRPGPRKNIVFSIYGACAPLGFFLGILLAGIASEYANWSWFFWTGAILSALTTLIAFLTIPSDILEKRNAAKKIEMDWLGSVLIVCGLILFTYAVIDSSHAPKGWKTPYIYFSFILGTLLLLTAIYVEARVATQPLLPASLFKVPCMTALFASLFFSFGSIGIFLYYSTFYMIMEMGASPFQLAAWYAPMVCGGFIIGIFGGLVLHLLPGTVLVIVSGISLIVTPLPFAIAPPGASYWAYVFPSMVCAPIGLDITFNVSNIFITTSLPKHQQGLAGAVISLLVHISIAVLLGFTNIVDEITKTTFNERQRYHAVFWFEIACAAVALIILIFFVKIKKAESDMTVDEKAEYDD